MNVGYHIKLQNGIIFRIINQLKFNEENTVFIIERYKRKDE